MTRLKTLAWLALCLATSLVPGLLAAETAAAPAPFKPDTGDTAWILISSAMVLLMTPGLALFYAGMVRRKNVLSTMMQSMMMMALISVIWVWFGYSLAFTPVNNLGGYIGGFDWTWLKGVDNGPAPLAATIPHTL